MNKSPKVPKRVKGVAYICLALGGIALVRGLILLSRGEAGLDPTILLLLAGVALLRGWPSARSWIGFYVSCVAFIAVLSLALVLTGNIDRIIIMGLTVETVSQALMGMISVAAIATVVLWALYSKRSHSPMALRD